MIEGEASGQPPPTVRFLKDGTVISTGGQYSVVRTPDGVLRLTVSGVTTANSGEYTFVAENEGGVATSSQQIVVSGKPNECVVLGRNH